MCLWLSSKKRESWCWSCAYLFLLVTCIPSFIIHKWQITSLILSFVVMIKLPWHLFYNKDSDSLMRVGVIVFRYGSCAKANDFDMYAPNASFEDPLTHAQGYVIFQLYIFFSSLWIFIFFLFLTLGLFRVKQIKSAFYSLPKVYVKLSFPHFIVNYYESTMMELSPCKDSISHHILLNYRCLVSRK